MRLTTILLISAFSLTPSLAHARGGTDLSIMLLGPDNVDISDTISVQMIAATDKRARNVTVQLLYPASVTASQYSSECWPISGGLECDIGNMRRNSQYTLTADLLAPSSAGSISVVATASMSRNDSNQSNNTSTKVINVIDPAPPAFPVNLILPQDMDFTACWTSPYDGKPASFDDCEAPPTTADVTLNPNGSVTTLDPNVNVTWSQSADLKSLTIEARDLQGNLGASFTGPGVSSTCFEGPAEYYTAIAEAAWRLCVK